MPRRHAMVLSSLTSIVTIFEKNTIWSGHLQITNRLQTKNNMHCLLILAKFQTLSLRKCDRSSVVESLSQMHFLRCKEQRNSKSYCIRFCTNYVVILHLPKKYNELKVQVDIAFSSSIRIALGVDITPVIRWVYHCQK